MSKPTGLVAGNSLRKKIGSEICQVGHPRKDWDLGMNLSMFHSNPREGEFDWRYWDAVYDKADANDLLVLARFNTGTHFSAWAQTMSPWIQKDPTLYIQASNTPANSDDKKSYTTRVPRYAHPRVRANHRAMLKSFRDRYKNRKSWWKVDAALGGFSSEGHTNAKGFHNSQFDMDGDWRWDYLADYVEIFGAQNVVMIANQGAEGIRRAVAHGIIYYRRDGVGAPYQMKELEDWRTGVDKFNGALDQGGFIAEPWDQLKLWPGNRNVQQDFMLTARQLVKLNCILFFNMDQEIPQQFIDNGFWPYMTGHFAEVNGQTEQPPTGPGPTDPSSGDGGGSPVTMDEYSFPVEVRGGQVKRVIYGGAFEDIEVPDYQGGADFIDEQVIPIPIVNGKRWNPRVVLRSMTGSEEWVIDPAEPKGEDRVDSFHCAGRGDAVVTFDGFTEPGTEFITRLEFETEIARLMNHITNHRHVVLPPTLTSLPLSGDTTAEDLQGGP